MNRKLLIGLGALAAVVLLGVFVVMPLVMPADDAADEPAAAAGAGDGGDRAAEAADDSADDAGEGADDAEAEPDPVDETFEVFTARDPFQQLVSDDGGQVTAIRDDSGSGDDNDDDSSGGSGSGDDDDDDDDNGSSGASVDGTVVELIEVYEHPDDGPTVQVTVNGTGYEVAAGDDFAQRFRALDVSGSCATLLYGDQRFTLCEGETIRK